MATPKTPHKISNVVAFLIILLALMFDGLQFFLTLTVFGSLFCIFISFIAEASFAIWFFLLGVSYFSGKKSGMKTLSMVGSVVIELVPFLDALPGITAGVIGVIWSTRIEERTAKPAQAPIPRSKQG